MFHTFTYLERQQASHNSGRTQELIEDLGVQEVGQCFTGKSSLANILQPGLEDDTPALLIEPLYNYR